MSDKKQYKDKKKLNKRTKFTMFAMFNIVWYAIVVIVASFNDHMVPDALTVAWFSAWTVELALLFGIKLRTKNESNYDYQSYQNNTQCYSDNVTNTNDNNCCVQDESNISDYDSCLG